MNYLFTLIALYARTLLYGIGMHLSLSVTGILFLGFTTVINISLYTLAIAERNHFSPGIAFLFAFAAAILASFLFVVLYEKVSPDSFSVLGLCSIVAFDALAKSWIGLTNGVQGISGIARPFFLQSLTAMMFYTALLAIGFLCLEWLFLKSPLGRQSRGFKEDTILLSSLGISPEKISRMILLFSGSLFSISGMLAVWHVQFLDPNLFGLNALIEILSIAILALRPRVRDVALATLFVILLPEFLRFLNITANLLGHLRVLLYSLLLIILLKKIAPKLYISKRTL